VLANENTTTPHLLQGDSSIADIICLSYVTLRRKILRNLSE
jgi:hypothetical protein